MREQNPAYRKFRHLLPPSGRYPARWVDIFSNTNDAYRYDDVEVVFVPRGSENAVLDRDFWDEFGDYTDRWSGNLGNSVAGWMETGGLSPEKVFGGMLAYGFRNRQVLVDTVDEFASIEECEWARQMMAGAFPALMTAFAQGRETADLALQAEAHHPWAKDMLDALRSEESF